MIFSDKDIDCSVIAISLIVSWLLSYWIMTYSRRWQAAHNFIPEVRLATLLFGLSVIVLMYFFIACKFFDSQSTQLFSCIGSLLGSAALSWWMHRKSFKRNELISGVISFMCFACCLSMGFCALLKYSLPDVSMISYTGHKYDVHDFYEWSLQKGLNFSDSYLYNQTRDTLYRVVVCYAIPGEDLENVYTITDTVAPDTFAQISHRSNYVMRPIPPFMRWSVSRTGRYRTMRSFIVSKPMFMQFLYGYDMFRFGLQDHRRISRFKKETGWVKEDPTRLEEYKIIYNMPLQ